jgi:hypothetical protein
VFQDESSLAFASPFEINEDGSEFARSVTGSSKAVSLFDP